LAAIALGHVNQEYPNKLDHMMTGPQDVRGHKDLHPIFYGSFDWHSCVHSHWLLASLLQSVTSMQEQTLTFIPKLIALAGLSLLLSPWLLRTLSEFTITIITRMGTLGH
jgi:hypothetical protein